MNLKKLLENGIVLFDGAMGTYISELDDKYNGKSELANIGKPDLVSSVHQEYIEAGSMAITTNTFAANRLVYKEEAGSLIDEGWKIAVNAAGDNVCVCADIGPIHSVESVKEREYEWCAQRFIDLGAENFIFETLPDFEGISETAAFIKEQVKDAFVIVSFAVGDSGFSAQGLFADDLLKMAEADENIDAIGLNCSCSVGNMYKLAANLKNQGIPGQKYFSVMPNAGYPIIVNKRTVYEGDPVYFAQKAADMAGLGAAILGGCCGTTPAHIEQIKHKLDELHKHVHVYEAEENAEDQVLEDNGSRFWDKLISGQKPIAVELDSPANADVSKFINGVRELKAAGTDIITIADCPVARARMDSSILACRIRREEDMEAMPHLTCRDRNLNATQALMLGLYSSGIRNMLLVTGDPVPNDEKDIVKTVYQFNSRKFAAFASSLSENMFPAPVHFFGALNVNARNFNIQLQLAHEKEEKGMVGFLTQPVLTPNALDNLKRAKDELNGYILGGIIPVVSEKNARFMNSEISGIEVDGKVVDMYVGKNREEGEQLAEDISVEIAKQIAPYIDGYYFITPFQRTALMSRILKRIHE